MLCVLMFIVSSDLDDILNSRTLQHMGNWIGRVHGRLDKQKRSIITKHSKNPTLNSPGSNFENDDDNSVPVTNQEDLRLSSTVDSGSIVKPDSSDSTSTLKGLRLTGKF